MRRHMMFTRLGAQPEFAGSASPPPTGSGGIVLDTTVGTVTGPVLEAGTTYTVTVAGTVSDWNGPLTKGEPEPDAMFPTTGGAARKSTQVGLDAETIFAQPGSFSHPFGAWTQFQLDTGSGWKHPTADSGSGHVYTYTVAGEGAPILFRWADSPLTDNYGAFRITIE